ncbi:MAG: hypothetical protein WCL04_02615 [Verrucomicrobiota bacterium]
MKTTPTILPAFSRGIVLALALTLSSVLGYAAGPTSKLYVAQVGDKEAEINTGERIENLADKDVRPAEGTTIQTKPDAKPAAVVLSNSTGVFFDPDTKLEVAKFMQEPFTPNRTDLETEPSMSQTQGNIVHGAVGLCTPKMVSGSSMVFNTPQASVTVQGRKSVISTDGNETIISAMEGDQVVRGDQFSGGQTIKEGQQAVVTRTSATTPPIITIRPIPDSQRAALNDKVDAACTARQKVYFQAVDSKSIFADPNPKKEIVVKEVIPPTVDPVITVSAESIP